ncbi:hypothetical protein FNV43_RR04734 [Rhamnella rubrinervis]|uniref:Pentatricopeptide repeat-containing protein n=1 Tax=Rhamnella rubrinervis TaxID=2594499 RepID=A0A8K0HKB7_9ROSA|nr:hypothetical protein FNV43_RR04734 [Rhamnella rubrinervis]
MVEEGLAHFVKLRSSFVRLDSFTYSIIVPCCDMVLGQQVHADVVEIYSVSDVFLGTNFIGVYAGVGEMGAAMKVFDEMPKRDLVAWNALISCYSKAGMGERSMRIVFKVWLFASSLALFKELPEQDVVAWTTIITRFSESGNMECASWLFYETRFENIQQNSFTFASLLSACAHLNAFQSGKQLHGLVLKYGLETDVVMGSVMLDMFSKYGQMEDAITFFRMIPEKDTISCNGIIGGYAQNGEATKALKLFDEMVHLESPTVSPNDFTLIGVLSACSHNGLLKEAYGYFNDMIHK